MGVEIYSGGIADEVANGGRPEGVLASGTRFEELGELEVHW